MSAHACIAVGYLESGGAIAGRWDGKTWQWLPPPPVPAVDLPYGGINGISCASAVDCIAVGGAFILNPQTQAFADRWDGSRWVALTPWSPKQSELLGVSCLRTGRCLAVGDTLRSDRTTGALIAEWWNGRGWHRSRAPRAESVGVSCLSPRFCLAAGDQAGAAVERWDGTRWHAPLILEPDTLTTSIASSLGAVACVSIRHCAAAGFAFTAQGRWRPIASVLTGSRWHTWGFAPAALGGYAGLDSVSCGSPGACVAVGLSDAAVLIERWNGHRWTREHPPNLGMAGELHSVSCTSASACIAVGDDGNGNVLVEQRG